MSDADNVALLRAELEKLRPKHDHVEEDPWLCCPKCEYCKAECGDRRTTAQERYGKDECICGADAINKRIDEVLERTVG